LKKLSSEALTWVNRALRLYGSSPLQETELVDGHVDLVLAINEIARRGNTLGVGQGIFTAAMRNEHAGSGTLATSVDPFNVAVGNVIAPYPSPVPKDFDVWLVGAGLGRTGGTGTVTASLSIDYQADAQGWGEADDGSAVVSAGGNPLIFWTQALLQTSIQGMQGDAFPYGPIHPIRLRRPVTFLTFSSTASAAADWQCNLILGVFPVTLGQDISG